MSFIICTIVHLVACSPPLVYFLLVPGDGVCQVRLDQESQVSAAWGVWIPRTVTNRQPSRLADSSQPKTDHSQTFTWTNKSPVGRYVGFFVSKHFSKVFISQTDMANKHIDGIWNVSVWIIFKLFYLRRHVVVKKTSCDKIKWMVIICSGQ